MVDSVRTMSYFITGLAVMSLLYVGGPEGLRALTNPKAIIVDRWPALIQTRIPKVLDYPIRSLCKSWCAQILCWHVHCNVSHRSGNFLAVLCVSCMRMVGATGSVGSIPFYEPLGSSIPAISRTRSLFRLPIAEFC